MCNFSHLQVGENCDLYTEKMECTSCGHASGGVSANAIYLGHSENTPAVMDRFSLVSRHICPNCGERFTIYQEFCKSWCFSISEAVEHTLAPDALRCSCGRIIEPHYPNCLSCGAVNPARR